MFPTTHHVVRWEETPSYGAGRGTWFDREKYVATAGDAVRLRDAMRAESNPHRRNIRALRQQTIEVEITPEMCDA